MEAVHRFVVKCNKHDNKFKNKKHDVLRTAVGLVLRLTVTKLLGWLCLSCQKLSKF
jgi:hypothetical protein